ncbi:MAG: ATP-dependent DNA helicase RecQ [Flavobacteriales bacterium]
MAEPLDILKKYWNYSHFRPQQPEIIASILSGKDTLALLPTGGGKSICFQVPGMCMEGVCLVVSPLVALMHDQVAQLKKRNIDAWAIHSALATREIDRILDNCVYGTVKFLYASPERLQNELFLARFKKMKISLIAVDEAHCISQWGYDFRPPYLQIAEIRQHHAEVPVLALSASATPLVVKDIQQKLAFKQECVIATSFARPNLAYNMLPVEDKEGKLAEILKKMQGSAIVYCGTRHDTKTTSAWLQQQRISSTYYHAGLTHSEREQAYKLWLAGKARVMCATNAFGMGIDKPDVRLVLHTCVPPHPEGYFQEAGRAGRDGQAAFAVLLHHHVDVQRIRKSVEQKFPPKEFIQHVYKCLCNQLQLAIGAGQNTTHSFHFNAFCKKYDLPLASATYALQLLELAGYLAMNENIFMPSRIMFAVDKQALYSYQVVNQGMDAFIKVLLRSYGGLFEQYTTVREDEIARNSKLELKQVIEKLLLMKQHGMLHYEPKNDVPTITMLTGRITESHIALSPEVYEWRKKNEQERVEAMVRLMHKNQCRSVQLLEYFGERNTITCGKCDVCRAQKKHGLQPEEAAQIHMAMLDLLMQREVTMEQLPDALPQFQRSHLVQYTRWKLDSGELILNDNLCIALPHFNEGDSA